MADDQNLDLDTVIPLLQGQGNTAAEVAAQRLRRGVQPPGGRQDSGAADTIGRMLIPGLGAAMDTAGGDYGRAGTEAALSALPYGGRFIPGLLKKGALALGAGAMGLSPGSVGEAEAAKGAPPPQQPPPSPQIAPQSDEDKEIAGLQSEWDRANEIAKHARQSPGEESMLARNNREYPAKMQAVRDRYRTGREFSQWQEGIRKDPSFQALPESMQNDVMRQKTMDEGNAALSEAKRKTTPFAQQNPDLVRNLELGGVGAAFMLPGLHSAADKWALNRAASRATKLAGQEGGDIAAERLRSLSNKSPNETGRFAAHALGGAAIPYFAGTVAPNLIDTFTLPHDSQGYQNAANTLNPTHPAFWPPIQRALIEGTVGAGAGTPVGHVLTRPDLARTAGKGVINALDKRVAKTAATEAPKVTDTPENKWSTPQLTPLYGAAANAKRKAIENKIGYQTVNKGPDEQLPAPVPKKPRTKSSE